MNDSELHCPKINNEIIFENQSMALKLKVLLMDICRYSISSVTYNLIYEVRTCISVCLSKDVNREFILAYIALGKVETVQTIGRTDLTQKEGPTMS